MRFSSAGAVTQVAAGVITAANLAVVAKGSIDLCVVGAPNQVSGLCWIYLDKVTGKVTGQFLSNPANLCDSLTSPSVTPCFSLSKPGNNLQVVFISRHNGLIHLSP